MMHSELNTRNRDQDGNFPHALQLKGLNGSGTVVTVSERMRNDTCSSRHRKLVYLDWWLESDLRLAQHGTQIAGLVAGYPLLPGYQQ